MKHLFITVGGTMGVGKTSFTQLVARELGCQETHERFNLNPFLEKFYIDMKRWAFHSEMFFLSEKIVQLTEVKKMLKTETVIQDTPIVEDVYGYVKAQYRLGNMSKEEWDLYYQMYRHVKVQLPTPNLIFYLTAPVTVIYERMRRRGREFELVKKKEDLISYLKLLDQLNHEWLLKLDKHVKTVIIDTEGFDYLHVKVEKKKLITLVKKSIHSLI